MNAFLNYEKRGKALGKTVRKRKFRQCQPRDAAPQMKNQKADMSRSIISVCIMALSGFFLAVGWIVYMTNFRHVEVKEPFMANIKNHQESVYGSLAVFDGNDTIYYYADHGDLPGIYKMNMSGEKIEFVVSSRDIKRIQIKNNNLYYLEYETDIQNTDISTKGYKLMKYDLARKESDQVVLYERKQNYYGIWNFCVGNKGIVFTDLTFLRNKRQTQEATAIKNWDGKYLGSVRQIGKCHEIKSKDYLFYLFDYDDLYCICMGSDGNNASYVDIWGQIGVYDKNYTEPVIGGFIMPRIIGQGQELFVASYDHLMIYDDKKDKVQKEFIFENTTELENAKIYGDKVIVFGKTRNRNDQILSIDNHNGTVSQLFEASEKEHVLYFDQEHYILFDQGKITKYTYSGDEIWTVNLGKIRNTEGYKTDTSGDWLFVTHWNKRKKVRELDAIINMVTGEAVVDRGKEFSWK